MRFVLFGFFILISVACCAAVYMTVDQNGNTTYSDVPSEHSQPVNFNDANGISTINSTQSEKKLQDEAALANKKADADKSDTKVDADKKTTGPVEKIPYRAFTMTNPVDQQTFQNDRSIPVDFKAEPDLQEGDLVQVYVDGNPAGAPRASTHIEIAGLNRGSHQFYGVLMDDKHTVLMRTAPITAYIHLNSAVTSPAFKTPQ